MLGLGLSIPQVAARSSRSLVAAIRSLFAANEPGVWYDPSDLSTLFQNAVGTTPVTAVEQPVGLMLDKSKGLTLGPELVTNGDFSDGLAGWSQTGTTWSPAGGTAKNDGTAGYLYKEAIVTVGAWVVVECTVADKGTAGSLSISLSNGGETASFSSASLVNGQRVSVRGVKTLNGSVYFFGQGGWNGAIDNISVRELPGNHAYQPTATSRPVLSARYNLLTKTEQFDDAAWIKWRTAITANTIVAPDGTLTGSKLARNSIDGVAHYIGQPVSGLTVGSSYTFSVIAKAAEHNFIVLMEQGANTGCMFNLSTGAFVKYLYSATVGYSSSPLGNGWWRFSIVFTCSNAATAVIATPFQSSSDPNLNTAGDGTSGIYIWGADLRVANDGANLPPYQRVNTATDYDTVGFPHYLRFDGVDDWMVTNTITPGIDKVQVFAGVRKLSDGARQVVAELGTGAVAGNDFNLNAPQNTVPGYGFRSRGTSVALADIASGFSAPITNVLAGLGDISGDRAILHVNGAQVASSTADQGAGNFLAYPLYIGRRGGTSLPFNGHLYSLIVRFGSNLPAATIEKTEKYINTKTRAY